MDSGNWRVKRESKEGGSARDEVPPVRPWERPSGNSDRSTTSRQQFSSPWGATPKYEGDDRDYKYRGGRNPARGSHSSAHLSGRSNRPPTLPDPEAGQAIDQGRRLYVGNLPYEAKLDDIRALFADIPDVIQDISMSVDLMTGRNPSYCFVDFTSKESAAEAMKNYNRKTFMRRPLKVKPGVKPRGGADQHDSGPPQHDTSSLLENTESPYPYQRWRRLDAQVDTESHNTSATEEGRRLYVGGLPRFPTQAEQNQEIRKLFQDYDVQVISKLVSPHKSKQADPGNHYYCFIDLGSREDADRAMAALNGLDKWNWNIVVSRSTAISGKLRERQRVYVAGLPLFMDEKTLGNEMKALFESFGDVKVVSKVFQAGASEYSEKNTGYFSWNLQTVHRRIERLLLWMRR
ncbi:Multiple RNA-binding domain-containing protein [Lachnellula subtilissima]|uniref:Multiple RNA-binding domain-containing protein n=1 Tax=Lachnellula subtilissima TaxID=602034 RepID=A0A8H8UDJ2_9HELO|nr:Multiple RNA-binding domain-containing protein [Lachnellula subtilissima]